MSTKISENAQAPLYQFTVPTRLNGPFTASKSHGNVPQTWSPIARRGAHPAPSSTISPDTSKPGCSGKDVSSDSLIYVCHSIPTSELVLLRICYSDVLKVFHPYSILCYNSTLFKIFILFVNFTVYSRLPIVVFLKNVRSS